eukprot:9235183-Pyramimonas_sp.AAC.1
MGLYLPGMAPGGIASPGGPGPLGGPPGGPPGMSLPPGMSPGDLIRSASSPGMLAGSPAGGPYTPGDVAGRNPGEIAGRGMHTPPPGIGGSGGGLLASVPRTRSLLQFGTPGGVGEG